MNKYLVRVMLNDIKYPGMTFEVIDDRSFRITMSVVDSTQGFRTRVAAQYEDYSKVSSDKFVDYVWGCVQNILLHEAAEWFSYNGTKPYYPHKR